MQVPRTTSSHIFNNAFEGAALGSLSGLGISVLSYGIAGIRSAIESLSTSSTAANTGVCLVNKFAPESFVCCTVALVAYGAFGGLVVGAIVGITTENKSGARTRTD